MFDALTGKLQKVFKNLRGMGKISDSNISDSLREVRMALLEADVNFKVVREFIEDIRQKAIGQEVFQSIQPGQQVIKIIHDELVNLLGSTHSNLNLDAIPSCILLCGLHGSGKTTSSGKLARYLTKLGKKPLLVAVDVYRPAAMDQLDIIGKQINIPVWVEKGEKNVLKITEHALKHAKEIGANVVIFDTAGRLQIDEPLVQELVQLRDLIHPREILLTLDAATGQEAVNVAENFNEQLEITGLVLTKLDGDSRGGAALSVVYCTQKPIKLTGVGEKIDALQDFHPDRMATRILGMGDIVSLVEKAQENFDAKKAEELEKKMRKAEFSFNDFLNMQKTMKNFGSLDQLLGMLPIPGLKKDDRQLIANEGEKHMKRIEAFIQSMTPEERERALRMLKSSRTGFRFDKSFGNISGVCTITLGIINFKEVTDEEIMGMLLHEIGHCFFDYIYIADLVRIIDHILHHDMCYQIYNAFR